MRRHWQTVARGLGAALLLASALCALLPACDEAGERSATGTCPAGETCDSSVVGLWFDGARPLEHTIVPVAIGANEVIFVCDQSTTWFRSGCSLTAHEFDAVSAAPEIVSVAHTAGAEVTLTGVGEGTTRLRILDRHSGLL